MKNNKKNLYILIPLMVIVWGGIAYQITGGLPEEDQDALTPKLEVPVVEVKEDTFQYQLSLNYDDPFQVSKQRRSVGGAVRPTRSGNTLPVGANRVNKAKKSSLIKWPSVNYVGVVKSSNKKKVGLLTINGVSHLAIEGETIQEIYIKSCTEGEIVLKFSGEEKTITK